MHIICWYQMVVEYEQGKYIVVHQISGLIFGLQTHRPSSSPRTQNF